MDEADGEETVREAGRRRKTLAMGMLWWSTQPPVWQRRCRWSRSRWSLCFVPHTEVSDACESHDQAPVGGMRKDPMAPAEAMDPMDPMKAKRRAHL